MIREATAADLDEIRTLFRDYQAELGVDLCFQGFTEELAKLPGTYRPILFVPGAACVALRPLSPDIGEMKRLYVRPAFRGIGLGRRLTQAIIDAARAQGFKTLRLDSLPQLTTAIAMYRSFGFLDIPNYNDNPIAGVVFLELSL